MNDVVMVDRARPVIEIIIETETLFLESNLLPPTLLKNVIKMYLSSLINGA
jgi:hypothetical protein